MREHLEVGDVVQISPERQGDAFAGCFMIVTDPKPWGAQGFIAIPAGRDEAPKRAYYRVRLEDCERIGRAAWAPEDETAKGESA